MIPTIQEWFTELNYIISNYIMRMERLAMANEKVTNFKNLWLPWIECFRFQVTTTPENTFFCKLVPLM